MRWPGPHPLRGLTVLVPPGASGLQVDGGPPDGLRAREERLEAWFDLEPGQTRSLLVRGPSGAPLDLMQPATIAP